MSIDERILARVEELRKACRTQNLNATELYAEARDEHIWALGSRTTEEATEHEITADAYRILAREKEEAEQPTQEFKVEITETLQRTITVNAKSESEAIQMAKDMYHDEKVVLGYESYVDTEFEIAK